MKLIHEVAEGGMTYNGINWWKPKNNPTLFRLIIKIGRFRVYFRARNKKYVFLGGNFFDRQVSKYIFKIGKQP